MQKELTRSRGTGPVAEPALPKPGAAASEVFTIRNLSKAFGVEQPYLVLDGIDLSIRSGEFLCLLGASGCGKSTLLNLLAGFDTPTSGDLLYRGHKISGPGKERVVFFQDSGAALLPWQTVQQNVEFGLRLQSVSYEDRRRRAEECLALVGLVEHRHKVPSEISGGMRQRLQIARALAVDPDVFLMDEPFGALDAITRRRMHDALLEIWQRTQRTIVFVTHDILEALVLADRIAVMSAGPAARVVSLTMVKVERPRHPGDTRLGQLYERLERLLETEALGA